MKSFYLSLVLMVIVRFGFAGSQSDLFVTVTGQHYGYPLPGAHVLLMKLNGKDTVKIEQVADDKGIAKFLNIDPGKYWYQVSFEKLYRVAWELTVKKNKLTEETIVIDDSQPFRKRILEGLVVSKSTIDSLTSLYDKSDTTAFKAPRYKSGKSEYLSTLTENTRTPFLAQTRKIGGKVLIKAVIDDKGNLSGLFVENTPNVTLDFNALWAVSNLKEWKPATFNGKPVASIIEVPVVFHLY